MKLQTLLIFCILLIIMAVGIYAVVGITAMRRYAVRIGDTVSETLSGLDTETASETLSALSDAAKRLDEIDTDKLNSLITSLRAAAEHLQSIDTEKLNALIESLEGTASALANVKSVFDGIFGR